MLIPKLSMSERLLSILLIGFTVLFLFIILGWRSFKAIFRLSDPSYSIARLQYDRLKGINIYYRLILVLFTATSFVYFYYPQSHDWLIPIHLLNNDYVNATGFAILLVAFILVIANQLKLDKNLHLYYFDPALQNDSRLVPETEKNLLKSILLVYVGLFTVLSTVATAILIVIAIFVYYLRSSNRQYRIKTPLEN